MAEERQDARPLKRSRKACTECRQQKAKCDAEANDDSVCSRCRKLNLNCVISDPFKRENKRQRLSELQKEADGLRKMLGRSPSSPMALLTAAAEMRADNGCLAPQTAAEEQSDPFQRYEGKSLDQTHFKTPQVPRPTDVAYINPAQPTTAQTLEGLTIEPNTIDDLFKLYFQDFNHYLPILDPQQPPNAYHSRNSLLFWAIIGVACRTYAGDPTLFDVLASRVIDLTLASLKYKHIDTVRALLLIATWPFPRHSKEMDVVFTICGSFIHMAFELGLHQPWSSEDFSRARMPLSESDVTKRAELWAYCIITYYRACASLGYPPMSLLTVAHPSEQTRTLLRRIPVKLVFQIKLGLEVTKCCVALQENGLRTLSPDQERALHILVRVFEYRIGELQAEASSDVDNFWVTVAKMHVQLFHLYKKPSHIHSQPLIQLYLNSCSIIERLDQLDKDYRILATAPRHFGYAMRMAAYTLLRLLKSSFAKNLDIEEAKASLFLAINLCRRSSNENNDIMSRHALVLTQLWNSDKAFKAPDGSEFTTLRIRSRLAMSPIFDAILWWREEFGNEEYLEWVEKYSKQPGAELAPEPSPAGAGADLTLDLQTGFDFSFDPLVAEFSWAFDDNAIFGPSNGVDGLYTGQGVFGDFPNILG